MTIDSKKTAQPLEGKTYSLHGPTLGSEEYYHQIHAFVDGLLRQGFELPDLLGVARDVGKSRHRLKKLASEPTNGSIESKLVHTLKDEFSRYTINVSSHLKGLSLAQRWDRTIAAREEQYHFAMLEAELVNRINAAEFRKCDTRLAFLPHCLHDLMADCQSAPR